MAAGMFCQINHGPCARIGFLYWMSRAHKEKKQLYKIISDSSGMMDIPSMRVSATYMRRPIMNTMDAGVRNEMMLMAPRYVIVHARD